MQKLLKAIGIFFVLGIGFSLLNTWYRTMFIGNLVNNAGGFLMVLLIIAPFAVIFIGFLLIRWIVKADPSDWGSKLGVIVILSSIAISSACSAAHSNVQTLVTTDCGATWKVIKVGETLPVQVGPCSYKVTIPDYPMQGEVKFKTSFANRVLANIEVSYDYVITDGIKFVNEAKYIGKMNTGSDDKSNSSGVYEAAENSVIDKRIREVASTNLIKQDIVDFAQGEFEDMLLVETNKILEEKGVRLNFISFVPIPEEQTRLAIDVLTAHKVYESKGLKDLGEKIIVARSGAPKILQSNEQPPKDEKEKEKE